MDSSPAILLINTDGSKILVNCGEGCQRTFLEHSQKLATVQAVCLTDLTHDTVGGLPGMILTVSDVAAASAMEAAAAFAKKRNGDAADATADTAKKAVADTPLALPGLNILGPVRTDSFLHSLRHFMRREKFKLHVSQGGAQAVGPNKRKQKKNGDPFDPCSFTAHSIAMPTSEPSRKRPRHTDGTSDMGSVAASEEAHVEAQRELLSFLFTTPPVPGKFQPQIAAALGVPKGPLFGKLKGGQKVTFVDKLGVEQTVESHQVVDPASPGVAVLVLNYPDLCRVAADQESSLILQDSFFQHLRETLQAKNVILDLVVHLMKSSQAYPTDESFWGQHLGTTESQHIFVPTTPEADCDGTPYQSASMGALQRSLVCPEIYRTPSFPQSNGTVKASNYPIMGRSMMEYTLLPRARKGFSRESLPSIQDASEDAKQLAHDLGAVQSSREILKDCADLTTAVFEGELLFTGTGSSVPCKHRNVTGMSLTMKNGNSILLDIGEGTVGQILRAQGDAASSCPAAAADTLAKIRAVWISHPHADHHLGILRLLTDRKAKEPLILLAPTSLFRFLSEYEQVDPTIRNSYLAFDCKDLVQENPAAIAKLQQALGVTGCRAVPVAHCYHSYAVVLDGTCFGRLVYSGDCRPTQKLAQAGQGADVLIHEATFEDGMEAEAALKRHSTVGEALSIANQMQAKCTILTHFSQRYPKIPPTPAAKQGTMPIVFAFDYMRLTPRTLTAASKLTPALRLLYPEDESVNDDGTDTLVSTVASKAMAVPGLFAEKNVL